MRADYTNGSAVQFFKKFNIKSQSVDIITAQKLQWNYTYRHMMTSDTMVAAINNTWAISNHSAGNIDSVEMYLWR